MIDLLSWKLKTIIALLCCIVALLLPASTMSFRLSRLFFDDATNRAEENIPVFPMRDLKLEFGEAGYECLKESAHGLDDGKCTNLDLEKSLGTDTKFKTPTMTPITVDYGVDNSFPIHSLERFKSSKLFGEIQKLSYDRYMEKCRDTYSQEKEKCDESERTRFDMNLNQPRVMQNYTTFGFQKTKLPEDMMRILKEFYNSNEGSTSIEKWYPGDTHLNHWSSRTEMLNVGDPQLKGGGKELKKQLWQVVKSSLSKWIETDTYDLNPASLYGVRIYRKGAILSPHVDRLPLVTSAIIQVAQNVNEPWPIELYAHDGIAHNVTLEPGDMLLYESHSVIHGRPYPLNGDFYANIFVHFEPSGHCSRHASRMDGINIPDDSEELYRRAQQSVETKAGTNNYLDRRKLPFYIEEKSEEARRWMQRDHYTKNPTEITLAAPPEKANQLAASGEIRKLRLLAKKDPSILSRTDENGWGPIHEAARSGQTQVLQYLIGEGVSLNERTNSGRGATALWWAEESNGVDHESVLLLKKAGAVRLAPKM